MGWVKCSERMPEDHGLYMTLVKMSFGIVRCAGRTDGMGKWEVYPTDTVIGWYEEEPLPDWAREGT